MRLKKVKTEIRTFTIEEGAERYARLGHIVLEMGNKQNLIEES